MSVSIEGGRTFPVWWPPTAVSALPSDLVVVSVNYNTKPLIARLLWSLYRFLGAQVRSVVVVDNGSSDGSAQLLQTLATEGLCQVLHNPQNRQHGPALSQALSHLASGHLGQSGTRPWVWLLDSDCIIARSDTAAQAITAATAAGAAIVGESRWNPWHRQERFCGFSLLLDPAWCWRAEIGAFEDGGDPVGDFEQSCRTNGVPAQSFPFAKEGYVIHLGRSTLAGVRKRNETAHPLFGWAQSHHKPHFEQVSGAQGRYGALVKQFHHEVPGLSADALVRACGKR